MAISTKDIVPINQVRSQFTRLAQEVHEGGEKVITKNGEGYVALVDAARLDHYHRLERANIHLLVLGEALQGLSDVQNGQVSDLADVRARYGR